VPPPFFFTNTGALSLGAQNVVPEELSKRKYVVYADQFK
jgi:hypothetical protein